MKEQQLKQAERITSTGSIGRTVAQGTYYPPKQQSLGSDLAELNQDSLHARANRLRDLASRVADQLAGSNNALHRGNIGISEKGGNAADASIDSILAQTESILEKAESEAIAIGQYIGGL